MTHDYDYIWMCNDAIRCAKELLDLLLTHVGSNWDVIALDNVNISDMSVRTYTSPSDFFQACAMSFVAYGGVLLNFKTMLKNVNWAKYEPFFYSSTEEKWCSYLRFYCNRMLEMNHFSALAIPCKSDKFRFSHLKKNSQWTQDMIPIICKGVFPTIFGLPDAYRHKKEICRLISDSMCFRNNFSLFILKNWSHFSLKEYFKYYRLWDWVTSWSRGEIFFWALLPRCFVNSYFILRKKSGKRELDGFFKRHSRIYIYGAGGYGYIYAEYFRKHGLQFDSFCVSKRKFGKRIFCNHAVYEFDEVKENLEGVGIVVALTPKSGEDVFRKIQKDMNSKSIFYNPDFSQDISFELGYRFF